MRLEDLPNEIDRKHAQREENRKRAITYTRKKAWMWGTKYDRFIGIERYDQRSDKEFHTGEEDE